MCFPSRPSHLSVNLAPGLVLGTLTAPHNGCETYGMGDIVSTLVSRLAQVLGVKFVLAYVCSRVCVRVCVCVCVLESPGRDRQLFISCFSGGKHVLCRAHDSYSSEY